MQTQGCSQPSCPTEENRNQGTECNLSTVCLIQLQLLMLPHAPASPAMLPHGNKARLSSWHGVEGTGHTRVHTSLGTLPLRTGTSHSPHSLDVFPGSHASKGPLLFLGAAMDGEQLKTKVSLRFSAHEAEEPPGENSLNQPRVGSLLPRRAHTAAV